MLRVRSLRHRPFTPLHCLPTTLQGGPIDSLEISSGCLRFGRDLDTRQPVDFPTLDAAIRRVARGRDFEDSKSIA